VAVKLAQNLMQNNNVYYEITIVKYFDLRDAAIERLAKLANEYDQKQIVELLEN
jgi:hypothetical protein